MFEDSKTSFRKANGLSRTTRPPDLTPQRKPFLNSVFTSGQASALQPTRAASRVGRGRLLDTAASLPSTRWGIRLAGVQIGEAYQSHEIVRLRAD